MLQTKLGTEVRVYGDDKYKFVSLGSPCKKKVRI
jgi:hypothetical protein